MGEREVNAYEQPDQPMFNRYDFLSPEEEREQGEAETLQTEDPNENNETGGIKQGETRATIHYACGCVERYVNSTFRPTSPTIHSEYHCAKCPPRIVDT